VGINGLSFLQSETARPRVSGIPFSSVIKFLEVHSASDLKRSRSHESIAMAEHEELLGHFGAIMLTGLRLTAMTSNVGHECSCLRSFLPEDRLYSTASGTDKQGG